MEQSIESVLTQVQIKTLMRGELVKLFAEHYRNTFSSVFFSPIMYNIILYRHFIRPISIINQRQKFVYFLILVISKLFSLIT